MSATLTLMGEPSMRLLTPRFGVITASALAYLVGWTMLYPVLPKFVESELGGNGLSVGLAVGSFGVTAALLRPAVGSYGDRYGRRPLVVAGMAVVAVSLLGLSRRDLGGGGGAFAFVVRDW